MMPVEKDNKLRALGFKGKSLIHAEEIVGRLEQSLKSSGAASAYCIYSSETGNVPLTSKKTAEKFRDAFNRGDLYFLREVASETPLTAAQSEEPHEGKRTQTEKYDWPEYTALDLADLFQVDGIPKVLLGLEMAKKLGNVRVHQYIKQLFEMVERYPEMPPEWRAALAGFPIIGEVIKAPALASLAELIALTHPYLGRKLRGDYHKRARPILRMIWEQVSWWTRSSGYQLMPRARIPAVRVDTLEELKTHQISDSKLNAQNTVIEDALEKGKTALFHAEGIQRKVEETVEGYILDIVSRLPDIDRQKGKVFGKRLSMTAVLMAWCHICPDEYERYRANPEEEDL